MDDRIQSLALNKLFRKSNTGIQAFDYLMAIIKNIHLTNDRVCIIIRLHKKVLLRNNFKSRKGGAAQRSFVGVEAIKKLVIGVT